MARVSIEALVSNSLFLVELDESCVQAYSHASSFAPVVVFETREGLRLVDGFHRVEAARRAGATTIEAEVQEASIRDAVRYAAAADRRPRHEPSQEQRAGLAKSRRNVIRFREGSGLPTDPAVIDWLMSQWEIGLAIFKTDDEIEWLAPLDAALKAAREPVRAYTHEHRDTWSGTWQEHERGAPLLCVAFTAELAAHRAALTMPQVVVRPASRTRAELDAIVDGLDPDLLRTAGARITMWGVHVQENIVHVGAVGNSEAAARELLHARYGAAVQLEWGVTASG
jgi:hypothetical protein